MLLQGAILGGMAIFAFIGLSIVIFVPICSFLWYQFFIKKLRIKHPKPKTYQDTILLFVSMILGCSIVIAFDFLVVYLLDTWIKADGGYVN